MNSFVEVHRIQKNIESLSIDKADLRKFLEQLQKKADDACDIESRIVETLVPSADWQRTKENLKSCSPLQITVTGTDGVDTHGSIQQVFGSSSFPLSLKSMYVNSELLYNTRFNYRTKNYFELLIDFSKPKIFDFSLRPGEKTPNSSVFKIEGQ